MRWPRAGAVPAALNFYATSPHTFDRASRPVAAMFADQAALALYGEHRVAHLLRALDSRDTIGQAKGILVERFGLSPQGAFDRLVRTSQDTNIKLVDVAHWVIGDAHAPGADAVGQRRVRADRTRPVTPSP